MRIHKLLFIPLLMGVTLLNQGCTLIPHKTAPTTAIEDENHLSNKDIQTITARAKKLSSVLNSGKKPMSLRDELNANKDHIDKDLFKTRFDLDDDYVASIYTYSINISAYNFKDIFVETIGEEGRTKVIILSTVNFNEDDVYTDSDNLIDDSPHDSVQAPIYVTEVFTFDNKALKLTDYARYSDM